MTVHMDTWIAVQPPHGPMTGNCTYIAHVLNDRLMVKPFVCCTCTSLISRKTKRFYLANFASWFLLSTPTVILHPHTACL